MGLDGLRTAGEEVLVEEIGGEYIQANTVTWKYWTDPENPRLGRTGPEKKANFNERVNNLSSKLNINRSSLNFIH